MALFNAIDIGRSGTTFAQFWLDTIAHNLANVNTINEAGEEPFRAHLVVAQERGNEITPTGSGVRVQGLEEYEHEPVQVFDPTNPLADEDGIVTHPVVDIGAHLTDLILAQRHFQLNTSSIRSAEEAYRSALSIGQRR